MEFEGTKMNKSGAEVVASGKKEKEQRNVEKEKAKELVDLLMKNYVDEGNNLRIYKSLYSPTFEEEKNESRSKRDILNPELESVWKNTEKDYLLERINSIQELLVVSGAKEELRMRFFNANADIKSRIIATQIVSDAFCSAMEDVDDGGAFGLSLDEIRRGLENESNPLFYQIYLKSLVEKCEEYKKMFYDFDYGDYEEERDSEEEHNKEGSFYEYHDPRLDRFKLNLTPRMKIMVNEGEYGDFYYDELYAVQKRRVTDPDYGRQVEAYIGDYLISKLAPEKYGVYDREGRLVGCLKNVPQKIEAEEKDYDPLDEIARELSFNFSVDPELNVFIKENPFLPKEEWVFMKVIDILLKSPKIQEYAEKRKINLGYEVYWRKKAPRIFSIHSFVKDTHDGFERRNVDLERRQLSELVKDEIAAISFESVSEEEKKTLGDKLEFQELDELESVSQLFEFKRKDERLVLEVDEVDDLLQDINFEDPDRDSFLFKLMLSLPFRKKLQKKFGIDIVDLDLKNQYYFLQYIGKKTEKDFEKVFEFVKRGKTRESQINHIKAFLSLEFGQDLSKHLFVISENLEADQADLIFAKYAEIAELALQKEEELRKVFARQEKLQGVDFNRVRNNLLKRAKNLLVNFSDEVSREDAGKKDQEKLTREIMEKLEAIPQDLILSAEVFSEVLRNQLLEEHEYPTGGELEELEGAQLERTTGRKLAEETEENLETRKQMEANYRRNYAKRPLLCEALVAGLKEKITSDPKGDKTEIFNYKLHQKVSASCRFDHLPDGRIYFGSMNVHSEVLGKSIGGIFMDRVINEMAKEGEIVAECIPSEDISSWYIRRQGFVVDQIVTDYAKYGEDFIFHIKKEQNPPEYFFKQTLQRGDAKRLEMISAEKIIDQYLENKSEEKDGRVIFCFPVKKEISPDMYPEEMKDTLKEYINEKGYVMTGYFFGKSDDPDEVIDEVIAYCALERSAESGSN